MTDSTVKPEKRGLDVNTTKSYECLTVIQSPAEVTGALPLVCPQATSGYQTWV